MKMNKPKLMLLEYQGLPVIDDRGALSSVRRKVIRSLQRVSDKYTKSVLSQILFDSQGFAAGLLVDLCSTLS